MKVTFNCFECSTGIEHAGPKRTTPVTVTYNDSCVYDMTCVHGHRVLLFTDNSKFEMIFEAGIYSLRDEYYREAVFNFALALERFYEYSILFFLFPKLSKNNYNLTDEEEATYQYLWNTMSKQSERQVGAFYTLFYNEFLELPPVFSAPWFKSYLGYDLKMKGKKVDPVYFRNLVVHQGITPTREQAIRYGEAVHQYIRYFITKYRDKFEKRISDVFQHERKSDLKKMVEETGVEEKNILHVGSGVGTFIAVAQPNYINKKRSLFDLFPI